MQRHIVELMPGAAVDAAALPGYLRQASIPLLHRWAPAAWARTRWLSSTRTAVRGIANLGRRRLVFPALPVATPTAVIMVGDKGADHVLTPALRAISARGRPAVCRKAIEHRSRPAHDRLGTDLPLPVLPGDHVADVSTPVQVRRRRWRLIVAQA
jgi:hypothetical protein